ncbi:MAG: acyl-ACP--UDP-N-acetylglucosamine O-acyltransferase [Cytophagales bacterium]|nr:MAG: acyl-ACP--UDP-N-acetylglucosamine O-acyltransferase [Cytophagales bacterium]TAF62085.1 MAG: acyl-ACP--UDP-N-acetylglucosamine O-acyltransferase [Cytophagales bacterium]
MQHPLACVHPNAKIGQNVTIEAFAFVDDNVTIGDNTWIGPHVTIMSGAIIGKGCKVYPGAVVAGPPQDLKYQGEATTAQIGDNTVIRECVTINKGTTESMTTKVGSNALIMAYVHVAHDCVVGNNCIIANAVQLGGHVVIDDHAIIGGTSAVHQFVRIGKHVMISGGSLVRKDVPPYIKAGREPLSYAGVNVIGLRRRGFNSFQIAEVQEVYRYFYQSGLNNTDALVAVEEVIQPSEARDEILNFIKVSTRGIIRGAAAKSGSMNDDM